MSSDDETYELEDIEEPEQYSEESEEEEIIEDEEEDEDESDAESEVISEIESEVEESDVQEEEEINDESEEIEEEIEDEEEEIFGDEELGDDMDMEDDQMFDTFEPMIKSVKRKEFNIDLLKVSSENEFYNYRDYVPEEFELKMKESIGLLTNSDKNINIFMNALSTGYFNPENREKRLDMLRFMFNTRFSLKERLNAAKDGTLGFNAKFWETYKDMIVEEVQKLKQKEEIESQEGSFYCPKCNKNQTRHYQVQLRSSDEPMSIIIHCKNKECRHRWRIG